jgi:hypothetical protein
MAGNARHSGRIARNVLQIPHSYFERLLSESVVACLRVRLLVTQRDHGIDLHRASRGNKSGNESDSGH